MFLKSVPLFIQVFPVNWALKSSLHTQKKNSTDANSIEQQLKALKAKMADPQTPSPLESLQLFNVRVSNSLSPVTASHQELMDFFGALQQYLKSKEDGKDVVTLQLLLDMSAQCGVRFPCTPSFASSLEPHSIASSTCLLHTVGDDTLVEIQEVWDDIRLQLRRHLLDRLSSCGPEQPGPRHISTLSIPEQIHCLQQLFFLYPQPEVLTHYQRLRSQAVLDLLSALCSSPGGETGFDRLAIGLCLVVPVLTKALNDEINILLRLAEPHTILGFINAAYLSTVARELACLMEKECEMAFRDSSTLSSKIKKYSARSRATVVPMERHTKNRNFSLTSHQLKALTQLASTLLRFERTVRELVLNMTFVDITKETPCVKGMFRKSRDDLNITADAKLSTEEALIPVPEVRVLEFDWRSAFRGLVPHMAHSVKVVLDDACAKNLQQEEALHSLGHTTVTLSPTAANTHLREDSFNTCSDRDTPKMVAKFCGAIMTEVDGLLPLAAACSDSSLLDVQSSFIEACGRAAFAVLSRLQERALEVPSSASLKNLPALLSTCIYVHQRIQHYHSRLKDSNTTPAKVPLTLLPIQKCQDTVEALRDQLTSYSIQVCSTCILQDVESHHWADSKPFYEGERCSFSVQMWFYFLCGLRSDLWAVLPADLAKEVLGQVLSETLQLLVHMYTRARPSYQRYLQVRYDITAVLLYVEHLMWSVCENLEALVHSNPYSAIAIIAGGSDWPYQIHSLCEQLLTVLIIVTAPLSLLYRMFITDPAKMSVLHQSDTLVVHWLHAINPDLFTEQTIRDGLMGQAASMCQLRLLTSDPGHHPRLLLRMLLYRDCHLPRILLENSYFCQESCWEISTESRKASDDFIVALFNLFVCLSNVPKALTHVLLPYLERAQIWEHLYSLADTTRAVPAVIGCVRAMVTKSTNSLLRHIVSMVTSWQARDEPSGALIKRTAPGTVLVKIPKEWNYTPLEARGKEAVTKNVVCLTVQTLTFIFANLPSVVASMPLPIRYLFLVVEEQLSQHSKQLRKVGLLLWALLGCLIQCLEDLDKLGQISGLILDRGAKEPLSLLAECLQATMGIQHKSVPKLSMHKVLEILEENRPKWMTMQLQNAQKLCSESVFERGGESGVAAAELTEQKIGLMLLEVCHKAGGGDYLRQIYHIIQGNEELLMFKLRGNTDSPSHPRHSVNFDLGSENLVDTACFNPLHQVDHIGKKKLDQSAVVDWAWDWPRLLPAYQGMSQVTFKTLLANRWEMQAGAELNDEEKAMVEELQRAYFVCSYNVGLQDPPEADEMLAKQTRGDT